jgi:redox-sensitive bicupin YhaK (pirin superfamily)
MFMSKPRIKPPKMTIRKAAERGYADHGWLNTYHTFSFAQYYDHRHMGFRTLRVINEDRVAPDEGFGSHPHQDMEILSYVVSGTLSHKDSMGHEKAIQAGGIQKITAGTGIVHSEYNASKDETVHFLQVWLLPREKGLSPSYEEIDLPGPDRRNPLRLIGSPEGGEGVVRFNQDANAYRLCLVIDHTSSWTVKPGRGVWIQIIYGVMEVNGQELHAGDGLSVEGEENFQFVAKETLEALVFDLA